MAKNEVVDQWRKHFLREKGLAKSEPEPRPVHGTSLYGSLAGSFKEPAQVRLQVLPPTQRQEIPNREPEMEKNRAGGYGFSVDAKTKLDRFLIIGTESATYYASAKELTEQSAANIVAMLKDGRGADVVRRIVEISEAHRAYRNDAALFALALCAAVGAPVTRREAMFAVSRVARTGGDFLKFVSILDKMRGHGNQFINMLRHWYDDKSVDDLAYQCVKYQRESNWSHRDILRLARPRAKTLQHEAMYGYLVSGISTISSDKAALLPPLVQAWEMGKVAESEAETLALIDEYKLTWEFVPNEKRTPAVWKKLAMQMPMQATLRYLSNFSRHELFKDNLWKQALLSRITDAQFVEKSKIHPIRVLLAHAVYQHGKSLDEESRRDTSWPVDRDVQAALEHVFMLALRTAPPTHKRIMVALDVSGSMNSSYIVNDRGQQMPITAREVAAAMSLSILATEPNAICGAFSGAFGEVSKFEDKSIERQYNRRYGPAFSIVPYRSGTRLIDFMQQVNTQEFGVTDCSLPMRYALEKRIPIDVFTIWTDNESWAGPIHPTEALRQYRVGMGIDAKLVVCACTAVQYSVADPKDPRQLDVVGFDANVANVINDFIRHEW